MDEEKASSASEYETDEEWEQERKKKQVDQLKEQVLKSVVNCIFLHANILLVSYYMPERKTYLPCITNKCHLSS